MHLSFANSSLSQQLSRLKLSQPTTKLQTQQPPPSLLFSTAVSRTIDISVIHHLALTAYNNLQKQLYQPAQLYNELLDHGKINCQRNHLTKQANNELSTKLQKVLLDLSSCLNSVECQKILDYLLRNYHCHTFESEFLAICFLQHYESEVYRKLLTNIDLEARHLNFLKPLVKNPPVAINFDMIVRAIGHDNYLLDKIKSNTIELLKQRQKYRQENVEVAVDGLNVQIEHQGLNPLSFPYRVFVGLLQRDQEKWLQSAVHFCLDLLKLRDGQAVAMAIMLLFQLLIKDRLTHGLLLIVVRSLVRKITKFADWPQTQRNMSDFILFVWQKYADHFDYELILSLIQNEMLRKSLQNCKLSVGSIFISLCRCYFSQNHESHSTILKLLKSIALRAKIDKQFIHNSALEEKMLKHLFDLYDHHQSKKKQETPWHRFQQQLLVEYYLFEFAEFINNSLQHRNFKELKRIFSKKDVKISEYGVCMEGIVRRMAEQPKAIEKVEKMQEQPEEEEIVVAKHPTLQQIIKSIGEYKPELHLIDNYYANQERILTQEQKNTLLQQIGVENHYTGTMFQHDIDKQDFTLPIMYIQLPRTLEEYQPVFQVLVSKPMLIIQNLLYRQLLRRAIDRLCQKSPQMYNKVLVQLNIVAQLLLENVVKTENLTLMTVIDVCNFIVQKINSYNDGLQRGKLYRIILVHVQLLTRMLSGIGRDRQTKDVYEGVFQLYGQRNLYIFIAGFAQQINKSALEPKSMEKLKNLLIGIFLESDVDHVQIFIQGCTRVIQMVRQILIQLKKMKNIDTSQYGNLLPASHSLSATLPHRILTKIFGLMRPKEQYRLVRNIIFLVRYIFLSKNFTILFDGWLKKMPENDRNELMMIFSQLYHTCLNIRTDNKKLNQSIKKLTEEISGLFPMGLLVRMMLPLLPNRQLYALMADKLQKHPKIKLKELQELVDILPEGLSAEYCRLLKCCLVRGTTVNEQWLDIALKCQDIGMSVGILAEVSKKQHYLLLSRLDDIASRLLTVMEQKDENGIAVAHIFIKNLAGLLDPYLPSIVGLALLTKSQNNKDFYQTMVQVIDTASLSRLATKIIHKETADRQSIDVTVLTNLSYFLIQLTERGTGQQLLKPLCQQLELISIHSMKPTEEITLLQKLQADIIHNIVLKLNASQLKKVMNNLVSWASRQVPQADGLLMLPFCFKRPILVRICIRLMESMRDLFIPYIGYFFDDLVRDLVEIWQRTKPNMKQSNKRSKDLGSQQSKICLEYVQSILFLMQLLFQCDTEEEFVDGVRFDQLVEPLSCIFQCPRLCLVDQHYLSFVENVLTPCLVSLCHCVKNDFKLKSLNYSILSKLKNQNNTIRLAIFKFADVLVEKLGDRYLVLVNDLVPYVAEHIYSNNQKVQKAVKNVINRIQQLSGQDLKQYIQNHRLQTSH